jgi:hypothetical protein
MEYTALYHRLKDKGQNHDIKVANRFFEGKRPLGRTGRSWMDNIKIDFGGIR